jgi:hypothetical protein
VSHRPSGSIAQPSTERRSPQPWSASTRFDENGLEIGGISSNELARTFGTPVMVVDEDDVRDRASSATRSTRRSMRSRP